MDLKIYAKTTARVFAAKKLILSFLIAMAVTGSMYGQAGSGLNLLKAQKNMVVVPVNSSLNISNNITLEAWINHSDIAGTQDVISKSSSLQNNGYIFPRTSDGWRNVQFYLYINSTWQILTVPYSGPTQTKRNQWHHLAATYDGTYMKIYVDGVQAGSLMVQGSIATNNNVLTIGGQTGYNNEYFGGSVDEVRVWNRALTQCEISAHKDCELSGSETGLAAYYKFNQGLVGLPNLTETTVYDASPNGNNGVLNGFLLTGLTSNWTTGAITTGNTCAVFTPVEATASSAAPAVGIGDDIQLFASAGDTYSWTGPNGFTSTEQNPVIPNATLAGTGVYTVVVTSGGCSASASVSVIVTYKGKALTFDGVKDQVRVPNSASLTSNKFTLEAWINPTSATPLVQSVMSKASVVPNNSGYIFPRTDDGWLNCAVWLTIDGSWVSYSVPYPGLNRWTHVAATYDGFNVRIYIDGQLMRDEPVTGTVNFGNNDLIIGNQEGYVWNFAGSMDEMRVWSRALTQCEIQNNMSCELNGANGALAGASGLSAYFRFNQGLYNVSNASTNTLVDSSGNANNGTLLNFNLSGLVSNWNLGGSVNNSSCLPYQAVLPTAGSNGPIVEVGHPIELTSSEGTSWAWTGPNGFTSTLQNPIINNSTLDMSGVYSVVITGNGCSSTASTKLKVAYRAYSLHFDGVNDQVVVPNAASLNMSSQITLEAWVYPTDSTRLIQDVMSKSTKSVNSGYIFPRTDDGWKHYTFYLHVNGAWQKLTAQYPSLNEWHHLAATYDGFYMRIYLDGVLSASRQVEGAITQNTNALVIGQQPEYTEYFTGYVDEARVWNRALSQCEIVAKKNCELDVTQQSDLAAYYKFNQGFGDAENTTTTTLIDASVNANNGALQNFALAGLLSNWATYFSADRSGNTCAVYVEPPVAVHPNGTLFGIGSTIKLSGTGSPTIYTWDGPNSFSQEDQVATVYNAQAINSGIYTLTVPMVNCVINKSVRITVANMTPLIISGPTTFCPSGSVTFTTPNTGTAYQWYRNDTAINGANTISYVANQSGNYSVAVTNGTNVSVSEVVAVTVEDNLAPVANIASLPTLTIEAPAVVTTVPTATDNCSGTITATTTSPLTYNIAGTYTITWKYDDGHGNISTQTQTVVVTKVVDTDPPVLAVPGNIMLDATACGATATFTATATDDSGEPVTITYSQQPGTEFPIGVTTVTVTAKDAANNTSTGTFTVTVADHTNPVLTLPADINATSATGINTGTATATDNCGTPAITHSTIPAVFPLGITNITWTATDAAGNTVSGVQKVTVTDVTAPVLNGVPANASASCGVLPVVPTVTATDDFDQNPVVAMTTANSGNTVTRTWTATDASGNTSTASQVITLIPAAAPIIAGPAEQGANLTRTTNSSNCSYTVDGTELNATATPADACGVPVLTYTLSGATTGSGSSLAGVTLNTGTTTITWTATNGPATSTYSFTVTVQANTPAAPVVAVADNCDNTSTLTATGSNLVWSTGATTSSITVNTAGSYTVTQSVNGCISPAATVTAAPKATPAAPAITVVSNCGNSVLSNNAPGTLAWSTGASSSSITVTDNGTYTVTAAVNGCTSVAASVNVTIATPVVVSAITGNTTVAAGSTTQLSNSTAGGTWSSLNTNIATVNAAGLVTGVAAGTATIHYVVTTPQGCSTTVTTTITVNASCIAPVLTSANVVAGTPASAGSCSGPVTYTVNVTGNPAATLTYTFSGATTGSGSGTGSGSVFNTGVTTVVVKAVNACGTTSTTFTVTLKDGTAPVPNVAVLPVITGQCSVSLAATTTSNNNYSGNYNCQYKKSWSCNDDCRCCRYTCHCRRGDCDCDRYSYRSRNVISMILYYIGNYYYGWGDDDDDDDHGCDHDDDSDGGSQVSNAPKATDNCKGTIVGTTTDPLTYNSQGTYTIHWKYDDGNGNVTIQEQTVIVKDDTKPVLNVPGNITVYCGSSLTPSGCNSTATATDNCSSVNITYSDVNNGSTIERTWKATDAAGNYSTGVQIITIKDNTRPSISDVADATVGCSSSTDPSVTGRPTASDACSEVTLTYSDAVNGNVITRTWKATDAAGNYSTSTQRITQGSSFNVNITSVPTNSTYTGGIATNLYLGYGAQSTKLQVGQLPSSGAPYTYSWTGSATSRLNSTSSSAPTFTPTESGTYTYVVTVTNKYGCSSTDYISICVTDIRVPGTKGKKVYVCHKSGNRWSVSYQTLEISVNAVPAHLENHGGCGNNDDDDRLGSCSQSPCSTTSGTFTSTNAPVTQGGVTSEGTTVNSTKETAKSSAVTEEELKVTVMPNPSTTYFTLKFESRNQAPLNLRVMDGTGRVIDAKAKIAPNSTLQIGHNYTSGTYYAEITQGGLRKVVQLIKARG